MHYSEVMFLLNHAITVMSIGGMFFELLHLGALRLEVSGKDKVGSLLYNVVVGKKYDGDLESLDMIYNAVSSEGGGKFAHIAAVISQETFIRAVIKNAKDCATEKYGKKKIIGYGLTEEANRIAEKVEKELVTGLDKCKDAQSYAKIPEYARYFQRDKDIIKKVGADTLCKPEWVDSEITVEDIYRITATIFDIGLGDLGPTTTQTADFWRTSIRAKRRG